MEEGDEIEDIQEEEEETDGVQQIPPKKREPKPKKTPCNQRIEELSTPARRIFLALWNEHAHHLPNEKVKHLRLTLQQMYAMTPEETAKYFAELRAEVKAETMRRKLKQKLRRYLLEKCHEKQKKRAYTLFKKLLKCGFSYAAQNPVPPLVSIRLRYLSDIILEQLCDLREIEKPCRGNPDKLGTFLISVADWIAIAVERLYYAAQVAINEMTNRELEQEVPQTFTDMGQPLASSTPQRLSLDPQNQSEVPTNYSGFGTPDANSTPKKICPDTYAEFGRPAANSTPRKMYPDTYAEFGRPAANSTARKMYPDTYAEFGRPAANSTARKMDPDTYAEFGTPAANSTARKMYPDTYAEFGTPAANSTARKMYPDTYAEFGTPAANSTARKMHPDTYNDFGAPAASSTPKRMSLDSQNRTMDTTKASSSLDPYYSIVETKPLATSTPKKLKAESRVPRYTFSHMKPPSEAGSVLEKSHLEMRMPKKPSRNKTGSTNRTRQ